MSLRYRLAILMLVALVPPLAITAYNTLRWQYFLERDSREEVLAAARLVAAELAQIVEGSRQLMIAMGRHPAVPDNVAECVSYFKAVIAGLAIYREAAVIDENGKFICSTIEIPPTLDVRDRLYFDGPIKTGELTIGTLVQGRVTRSTSIHISMPLNKGDGVNRGVIVLILNPERLAQDLSSRPWRTNHRVTVMDRNGSLVFTIPQTGEEDAREIAKAVYPTVRITRGGVTQATDAHGRPQIVGFSPLEETPSGLITAVSVGRDIALAEVRDTARRSILFGLAAVILAVTGMMWAANELIRRPVKAIVAVVNRRERGDIDVKFPNLDPRSDLGQLSAALSRMSDSINGLLEQKTFLLRELQHRVMNSLNLLSSVLDLQRRHTADPDARDQLARARDRVISIGAVYRQLYQADHAGRVEFAEFLKKLCEDSQNAYGGYRHRIEVDAEPLQLSGSKAVALAVLTHELITNVLKHAYAADETGPIFVSLKKAANGSYELKFSDRGKGLPPNFDPSRSKSLGIKVIQGTAKQLGGSVEIVRLEKGTEFLIRLPPNIGD
ncbi:sensor histidine kinase [Pseudorhodoplanes sp.]|uniref:sensor histidine kinase n=1 Tax=Pseudorhodoplanes sp. TaxID=1934341 RepID=UPI002D1CF7B6|nr:histidine kinase dimerization/phosphoacceptor domain -containing protein [Pseudorhodoplanes sp.]HWV55597.1 histidine kinase dimerization/phosphoacceptor domain -containing protein [Pseudorhodoplanes sp.]